MRAVVEVSIDMPNREERRAGEQPAPVIKALWVEGQEAKGPLAAAQALLLLELGRDAILSRVPLVPPDMSKIAVAPASALDEIKKKIEVN